MPEAPVHKDDLPPSGKHEIRRAGQISSVEPKSEPHAMYKAPHSQFGRGVFGLNRPHGSRAHLVHHRLFLEFYAEARVTLAFGNDCVIAIYDVSNGSRSSFTLESTPFIDIGGNKLLDFDNVQAIFYTRLFG